MKTLCLPINLMAVKSITLQRGPLLCVCCGAVWGGHLVQIRGDGFKLMMLSGRARGAVLRRGVEFAKVWAGEFQSLAGSYQSRGGQLASSTSNLQGWVRADTMYTGETHSSLTPPREWGKAC